LAEAFRERIFASRAAAIVSLMDDEAVAGRSS
jgi:hypothetical protein